MKQLILLSTSLQILFGALVSLVRTQEITYHLVEENRKGFVLGNLNHFISSKLKTVEKNIKFLISSDFFEIENESKNVLVKVTIDLDTLCSRESLCCNEEICIISTKVVIEQNRQYSGTFHLKVEIKDINDNPPLFLDSQQVIRVSENIPINTSISIESAIDKDFSRFYRKKTYELIDQSATFLLNVQQYFPDILYITVIRALDFEIKQRYLCHLRVCDSVFQNCIRKSIIVEVTDENDNNPIFQAKKYSKIIPENFPLGKEIIRVQALDIDSEKYNKSYYGFVSSYDVNNVFDINPSLGIISLKKKLSVNIKERYRFKVYAIDSLSVSHMKDYAVVQIDIEDINDNEPIISLLQGQMPDFYSVSIDENTPPKGLFSIQVTDKDKGKNGLVNCTLETQKPAVLSLKPIDNEIYQIQSVALFDYEQVQTILAQIICADGGHPQLISRKGFRVFINDINEFHPEFKQKKVELYLNENLPEGKLVLSMEATDADKGAVLLYHLDDVGRIYFKVNPKSGAISTSKVNLDRETREKVQFSVLVTDSPKSSRTSTAVVTVLIVDQNDNPPKFVNFRQFKIAENQYVYTKLATRIEATDSDVDENNHSIMYRLISTYNYKLERIHDQIFDVNGKGEIETMAIIDREKDSNFTLTILAEDRGKPALSTSTNITISILDLNDNTPMWIYPDAKLSYEPEAVLNVSKNVESGAVLTVLKAVDIDSEDAGRIGYQLLSTDRYSGESSLFQLNKSSGVLTVGQSPLSYGTSQLRIRAHDYGQPQLYRDSTLIINIMYSGDTIFSSLNMVIIIGMLVITATISVFLIVAIIFIRRSPTPPVNLPCRSILDDKFQRNQLEISCQNLFDKTMEKEPVFTDSSALTCHWGSLDLGSNLTMYPQNSSDGGCTTYVRFATPCTFTPEVDGESADSGKGTSDLEMNLHSTLKVPSLMNPYNHIQLIPSSKTGYLTSNNYLRRSYQIINEADKYATLSTPILQQFVQQQNMSNNIQGQDLQLQTSSYQEIPFTTLPPYRS